jgi:hypothetical protein
VVRSNPPELIQGSSADLLLEILDGLGDSPALTVVWETAVIGYLSQDDRRRVFDTIAQAGERRPLAFVRAAHASNSVMAHYGLVLQLWPGGERDELAYATHHGDWIDWRD